MSSPENRSHLPRAWEAFLVARGATIAGAAVAHFGDPAGELAAAVSAAVIADLSHQAVIEARGADAGAFLQGQLTNDIGRISPERAQWSGYCSPKGRLLAVFLIWLEGEGYRLLLPAPLAEGIRKRLSMYVLRSKVELADTSSASVRIGLGGPGAQALLASTFGTPPEDDLAIARSEAGICIRLPGGRYLLAVVPQQAEELWQALSAAGGRPVGAPVWDWLAIAAGTPVILPATQETFVPQMVNLDRLDGISFRKGCYTGQEIVARMHYLGRLKRRMYRVHLDTGGVSPGDPLFSPDLGGQASGQVVLAAPAPGGGSDALAVIQIDSAETRPIHWKAPDGPRLSLLPLPYSLE